MLRTAVVFIHYYLFGDLLQTPVIPKVEFNSPQNKFRKLFEISLFLQNSKLFVCHQTTYIPDDIRLAWLIKLFCVSCKITIQCNIVFWIKNWPNDIMCLTVVQLTSEVMVNLLLNSNLKGILLVNITIHRYVTELI